LNSLGREVPSGVSVLACSSANTDITILRSWGLISDATLPRKTFPPLRPRFRDSHHMSDTVEPTAAHGLGACVIDRLFTAGAENPMALFTGS
jgi:hypothetical protein